MSIEGKIIVTQERRPCLVTTPRRDAEPETRRAFLHCFAPVAEIVPPSIMKGGHNGGQLAELTALVEFEDGIVQRVEPECVRFLDSAEFFQGYDWGPLHEPAQSAQRDCYYCAHRDKEENEEPCRACLQGSGQPYWEARP